MDIIKILLGIALSFGLLSTTFAEEVVRLTNGEWVPYTSKQLKHYGVFSHIVTEAFAQEGITVEYKFFPWKRGYVSAAKGHFDGSVTWAPTSERKKDFYFTDPVTYNQKVFFHLKSYAFDWEHIDDLKGLKIGGTAQYTYGAAFDQAAKTEKIQVQYVTSDKQNVKKLLMQRIHIFPMEIEVGYHLIRSILTPEEAQLITHHPKPVQQTPICVVISKKLADNQSQRLVNLFNKGLTKLKESGKYDQYMEASRRGEYTTAQ